MNQAVDSGLKSHKCAEGNYAHYLALYDGAYGILLGSHSPGLGLELLITEGYALFLDVYVADKDFDLLTYGKYIGRMLYAAPCYIGNMYQTVNTADINKRAEIGQAAHNALYLGADLQLVPKLLLSSFGFFLHNRLMGCYDALAGLIDLNDLDLQILAYELADILNILGRQLRCGNKSTDTVDGGD